ncbi:MAG: beta-ketoacyl synthase chain length factor [Dysgonamonadaceae bacterium]|jgi:3-oxoacyl-(acyl-carrier-protein) synthase|nr:beta-ketoacyl synthase chain length factor [Dysgonamonadaceae bacterium]
MRQEIVITGMGIISALGNNRENTLIALREQRSGIAPVARLQTIHSLPVGEVKYTDAEMMRLLHLPETAVTTRTSLLGTIAVEEALRQANIPNPAGALRIALISGTTVGGMDRSERYYFDFLTNDTQNDYLFTHNCGACTELIADHFGIFSFVDTVSTACSSAANAIMTGAQLLGSGRADIVVAGGSECLTQFHLNGFNALMILDPEPCKPFDANRAGLNLGEGAAYLVMETKRNAEKRQAKPLCGLSGYANTCDAFHQTASSPEGDGACRAMRHALAFAGLLPEDVDYINAHGTGTQNNDLSEGKAIERVFGKNIPPVSSTKAFTGHATSAAGGIEAVISILALLHNFIPVNLNFQHQIEELNFEPYSRQTPGNVRRPVNHVLSNSFGFGGNNTSLVFSKIPECGRNKIYLSSAKQISVQPPLTDSWMDAPIHCQDRYVRAVDPDYRQYFSPNEARRYGKILKRALLVSRRTLDEAGIQNPDAIITGTGFGCVENTGLFLNAMLREGEKFLQPTHFMQSTHNTIGSLIAIDRQSYGYNSTCLHKGISFECALLDAYIQLNNKQIQTALVGAHDEMTPNYYRFLRQTGYFDDCCFSGETAVAMLLSAEKGDKTLCLLEEIEMVYTGNITEYQFLNDFRFLKESDEIDAVMTGIGGNRANDAVYRDICSALFPNKKLLRYKHLFGESYTAPAFGVYAAAICLLQQRIPAHLFTDPGNGEQKGIKKILCYSQFEGKTHSFILLSSC